MRGKGGKLVKKLSIPKIFHRSKSEKHARITNESVAEHRERVIAEGRRFKYPLQYAKHRLVINTMLISIAVLVLLVVLGWWQLYVVQNTSSFFYRVSQVLSLPVGSVDGAEIKYSDYLLYYRPSEFYLNKYDEIRPDSQDGMLQLEYKKRDAMDRAIADAYARHIAKQKNISVGSDEVDEALEALTQADNGTLSEEAVKSSALQVFGMSEGDTRAQYRNSILRGKVAFALDDEASGIVKRMQSQIDEGKGLKEIGEVLNAQDTGVVQYGVSGNIGRSTVFNGVNVRDISEGKAGVVVGPLRSLTSDGYLFTRILSIGDSQVNFEFVHVPLTTFKTTIQSLKDDGKVHEYITIDPDRFMSGQ